MKAAHEIEYAHLLLRVETGAKTRDYYFSIAHFQFAMTLHNFICAKNDGREPSLYIMSSEGSEVLNNRMEFERAKKEVETASTHSRGPGIIHPGFYPGPGF